MQNCIHYIVACRYSCIVIHSGMERPKSLRANSVCPDAPQTNQRNLPQTWRNGTTTHTQQTPTPQTRSKHIHISLQLPCDRCTEIAQSTSLALKYCRLASQPAANKAEANRHRTSNQSRGRARPVFVRKSACFLVIYCACVCAWVSSVNAFFVCEQEENQPPSPRRARNSTSKQQEEWSSSVWKVNKYNLLH